jgi:hypothetical protein
MRPCFEKDITKKGWWSGSRCRSNTEKHAKNNKGLWLWKKGKVLNAVDENVN